MSWLIFKQSIHFQASALIHRSHCRAFVSSCIAVLQLQHDIADNCFSFSVDLDDDGAGGGGVAEF